jgi:sulfane dehydrogenase subunit SoxC
MKEVMTGSGVAHKRLVSASENHLCDADFKQLAFSRRNLMGLAVSATLAPAALSATEARQDAKFAQGIGGSSPPSYGLGHPVAKDPYGSPSKYQLGLERRSLKGLSPVPQNSASFTPLQGLFGIITPSGLHYERHHSGWIDPEPSSHKLMISGSDARLLRKPMVFSLHDLLRLPAVSRIHFLECSGNTGTERMRAVAPTVQYTHGLLSCSEFTGVPLRLLLEHCGVDFKKARYVLAEGADAAALTRTIPMELIENDEVLVAYGQNGEHLRPENGFPLRLVVPGVQGVSWVKWLRRIEVGEAPYNTRDEALKYIDLMPDGMHRQYTSTQEVKSVILSPSGGQTLAQRGFHAITGVAWSGRGKIKGVDVSVDGGRNWREAQLTGPVLDKCLTRFHCDWVWNGDEAILQSRAIDETGHVQPTYAALRSVRGTGSVYHNNAIQSWGIESSGEVSNVQVV